MSGFPRAQTAWLLAHFEEFVSGVALLALVLAVSWGVVTRYVTATPAAWTGDAAAISFAWLVFVGSAAAFKYGMHMSIDICWRLIPMPLRRFVTLLTDLLVLAFLAYSSWLGLLFCANSMGDPMPILRWPRSVLYASVLVGFVCMFLRYLRVTQRHWTGADEASLPVAPGAEDGEAKWA